MAGCKIVVWLHGGLYSLMIIILYKKEPFSFLQPLAQSRVVVEWMRDNLSHFSSIPQGHFTRNLSWSHFQGKFITSLFLVWRKPAKSDLNKGQRILENQS